MEPQTARLILIQKQTVQKYESLQQASSLSELKLKHSLIALVTRLSCFWGFHFAELQQTLDLLHAMYPGILHLLSRWKSMLCGF